MSIHRISPTPQTIRWGSFDAAYPPLITVNSGDTVVLECLSAGGPEAMPPPESGLTIPRPSRRYRGQPAPHERPYPHRTGRRRPGPSRATCWKSASTGSSSAPIGGFAGSARYSARCRRISPNAASATSRSTAPAGICRLPWGTELPLAPFFGVMGVAPPPEWGTISTKEPRAHGGNLDNKELTEGAVLFLPVFVPGANFSAGDGHGVQGDGEVCINALEICLTGSFTLVLHKGRRRT